MIGRQVGRQVDRQTDRQIERQIDRQIERQIDRQIERKIDRQTDRLLYRQIDKLLYLVFSNLMRASVVACLFTHTKLDSQVAFFLLFHLNNFFLIQPVFEGVICLSDEVELVIFSKYILDQTASNWSLMDKLF